MTAGPAPLGPPRVLVISADALVRRSLARAVQSAGGEADTAGSVAETLARLPRGHPGLVVLDAHLPGAEPLIASLREAVPAPTVALLGDVHAPAEVLERARSAGARVLVRPVSTADVRDLLASAASLHEAPGRPIITECPRMQTILSLARRVARTEATVLIQGETGTGKELLAWLIHQASSRARGPLVPVNCSALPETLIEAELFGHERGAFTGALSRRLGRFELAAGGTLLLDEVTEVPLAVQAKLLRALQERVIDRVGSSRPVPVDVRVVAVTNRDLREEVLAGRFRPDLFYRLNVVSLRVPPLRERMGDVPLLARHFLETYAAADASRAEGLTAEAMQRLLAHRWPGNVRELENVVRRAAILCPDTMIGPEHVLLEDVGPAPGAGGGRTVVEAERDLILSTLRRLNGNRTHAARALGVSVRTIRNRLREYRLICPELVC
jgi:two-component system response regulator FlrC